MVNILKSGIMTMMMIALLTMIVLLREMFVSMQFHIGSTGANMIQGSTGESWMQYTNSSEACLKNLYLLQLLRQAGKENLVKCSELPKGNTAHEKFRKLSSRAIREA
mmetsp:Transcript_5935/g.12993  ORF Transcript_5935/g.12993 Transcript_5935/m.12993 type:complete len:107 (+) Transcript_5935:315-635(+)